MDAYTLAAIDLLHFFQQIDLARLTSLDTQNLLWILRALSQLVAGLDICALFNTHAGIGGNIDFPDIGLLTANGSNHTTIIPILQEDFAAHTSHNADRIRL